MNHTNFDQIINIFILFDVSSDLVLRADTHTPHTHSVCAVCVNSSELNVKASLDTRLSPGFRTSPSVSLKRGSRPAKGEQHANEYTRVHGHKTGKSYVLEGARLFLEHSIESGEVVNQTKIRLNWVIK